MLTFRNILFALVAIVSLPACKQSFLDLYPQTSVPPALFFQTEEDLKMYTLGLLSVRDRGNYLSDQDTDDKATTGAVEVKTIMTGTATSQTITGGWSWDRLRNINYFLDNYNKAKVGQDVKDHYAGIARYYRALFYFDKVKRFSNVPWYSSTINPSDTVQLYKGRDPRAQVMDSVIADLEFAAANVRTSVPVGTPGKWVMKLMLAKIALYEGTYRRYHSELGLEATAANLLDKAWKTAEDVMTNSPYKLSSDYAALFNSASLAGNSEVMLMNVYDQDLGRSGNNNTYINNYEQSPARELVQTYLMKDGSRFTAQPNYQNMQVVQEFKNRDPRIYASFITPGFVMAGAAAPYIMRLNKNFSGYHQLKGYINSTDSKVINNVDFPAYRFAEVLLIFAEAKAESGSLSQADIDKSVKLLRDRAGMPNLNMAAANADVDPILAAKYSNVTGANKGVILEIRREKRVEFAMEGLRYDDLMRWGAGKSLETIPEGMYFPGLGKYDLNGDGIEDIILIDKGSSIPPAAQQESNSLGVKLVYYKAGSFGEDVTVYLKNGTAGGSIVTDTRKRTFQEPKHYYRPVPFNEVLLNPRLGPQLFNWE
ncbi:RagB/SusD family nutrient uptake outer membrane protein [Chitinophaga silvatica]|uniref:RagB/SusD family nutrient uptake outer membrane protein n=1 Tax=Chitinophaga silvatica TaxID=2282649 RepID=A0A3E1YFQ3_9BACT|nr:RagB/SusD family nutrient uptake outer membrane protein [Chitinophaga silvatica]RFS26214.1 RagB/SusD family nutrient uptake outer membrane protein [Chitinophaga silvatica]